MKFFKKTDLIIIVALLVIAGAVYMVYHASQDGEDAKAEIYLESRLVQTISLSEGVDRIFSVEERPAVTFHLYEDGSIAFEVSDCPDKVCIHSGRLHIIGQSAACLPNGLVLKIVPANGDAYDENDMVI